MAATMKYLFLLMLCILFVQPLKAQESGVGVTYDSEANWYVIRYESADDGFMPEGYLRPADRVAPRVEASVTPGSNPDRYRYAYVVANEVEAIQGVYAFSVLAEAPVDDVTVPNSEWQDGFVDRASLQQWAHTGGDSVGIPADAVEAGFAFESAGLPVVTDGFAGGHMLIVFDDYGPTGTIRSTVDSLMQVTQHVNLKTIGPKLPPDPYDPLGFLESIGTEIQHAADAGWIAGSFDADIGSSLDLTSTLLAAGDSSNAAGVLVDVVTQAQSAAADERLTESALSLLTLNLAHVLRFLPRPLR